MDGFNANWQPKARLQLPDPAFWFQWRVSDLPVANAQAQRPWLWGPTAIFSGTEPYADTPLARLGLPALDILEVRGRGNGAWYEITGDAEAFPGALR